MRYTKRESRSYIVGGLTYFGSYLKNQIDRLDDGDTVYCDVDLPEGFTRPSAQLHFYKWHGVYAVSFYPETYYYGFRSCDYPIRRKLFRSWPELVSYCKHLPYLNY